MICTIEMIALLRAFFGRGTKSVYSYERDVVNSLLVLMPTRFSSLVEQQLCRINLVQRSKEDTEVNLYPFAGRKIDRPDELALPSKGEAELGKVTLRDRERDMRCSQAGIWLVNGWLFSINFDTPPKLWRENSLVESAALCWNGTGEEIKGLNELGDCKYPPPRDYALLLQNPIRAEKMGWSFLKERSRPIQVDGRLYYIVLEKVPGSYIAVSEDGNAHLFRPLTGVEGSLRHSEDIDDLLRL